MIWLGVDGGGTKTAAVLVDDAGRVLGSATAAGSYYLADGLDAVRSRVAGLIDAVCNDAGVGVADVGHAFLGLPGYGEVGADTPVLDALPGEVLADTAYTCGNDMICAWAGSLAGADGVNVIAGTGSITYGERDGRGARVGGWSEIFGDEGSAYWIGVEGLRAAARMSDGRRPRGPLLAILLTDLGLTAELDLIDVVHNRWRGDRSSIAALARTVAAAADAGDTVAREILAAAGRELADLVTTTGRLLEWPAAESMPVSWSGGVFGSPLVRRSFETALAAAAVRCDLREPVLTPVLGAALHAATLAGSPLTPTAVTALAGSQAQRAGH